MSSPYLYPNVTSLPGQTSVGQPDKLPRKDHGKVGEFDQVFEQVAEKTTTSGDPLAQTREPLKFSTHASQRLSDRKIKLDANMMAKVNAAVDKAAAKGIEDTLVLTDQAALIVSVKNRTVITAMDRASLNGNVFTNIDGAVVV